MGMGSPDNRRKADGSYQTQGVGRNLLFPAPPEKGRTMAGLPTLLSIAIWFTAALCVVGAAAYSIAYGSELMAVTALVGTVTALIEWRSSKHDEM